MNILFDIGYALSRFTATVLMGCRPVGVENLPRAGGFILASNHISNLDPPLVGCYVPRRTHFLGKRELFETPVLKWIVGRTNMHPVRRGGFDRAAVKTAVSVLKSGAPLVMFPEGTRSKTDEFLEPKAGIGMIAREALAPIIPCYIQGSNHFKRCLVRRERLQIAYGAPLGPEWLERQSNDKEGWRAIAREVMRRIGELKSERRAISSSAHHVHERSGRAPLQKQEEMTTNI